MDNLNEVLRFLVDNYLELILTILFALLAAWAKELKEDFSESKFEDELMRIVQRAVLAAEEAFDSGADREEWVVNVVSNEFPNLDREYIRMAVKAAVRILKSSGMEKKGDGATNISARRTPSLYEDWNRRIEKRV